jgi:RNA polymerase sigma-70 factor, ECF subfamily
VAFPQRVRAIRCPCVKSQRPSRTGSGVAAQEERFNALYAEHVEAVRRYVWRRDAVSCDDVVAETFLVAWRRIDSAPSDARPWLIGVARNVLLNARRSARRRDALSRRLAATAPRNAASPSRESELVETALAKLSEKDREVLLLSVWDDLDRSAIANILGCSKANVSVRLHRARRRLDAALAATGAVRHALIPGGSSDV